jgi:acetate kinase
MGRLLKLYPRHHFLSIGRPKGSGKADAGKGDVMTNEGLKDFLLHEVELLKPFSDQVLDQILEESTIATFEPNEFIIEYGESGRFLGILLEGRAELSLTENDGTRKIVQSLEPRDHFGVVSMMTGNKTMMDCICTEPSQALLISALVI